MAELVPRESCAEQVDKESQSTLYTDSFTLSKIKLIPSVLYIDTHIDIFAQEPLIVKWYLL